MDYTVEFKTKKVKYHGKNPWFNYIYHDQLNKIKESS